MPVVWDDGTEKYIVVCTCGTKNATGWATSTARDEEGRCLESCDVCSQRPMAGISDVYWDGKPELGLADDPRTGEPIVFVSRSEKAAYLKERGICEAGDRIHGAPRQAQGDRKMDSKAEIRAAIDKVMSYGQAYRRQELNRIRAKREGRI